MSKAFEEALREQIVKRKQNRRAKRILDIIDGKKTKRRERILKRLEQFAVTHLLSEGYTVGDGQWGAVGERDWDKFFEGLLKLLLAILPLILPLFTK